MERLYCPDFTSVFGPEYANPFLLPNIDSQIWPILIDFKIPDKITRLLKETTNGRTNFYHRKIVSSQLKLELQSSSIQIGLLQSLEINSRAAIPNEFTIKVAQKIGNCRVMCSIPSDGDKFETLKELVKKHKSLIVGVVLYPKYQYKIINSSEFSSFLQWIDKNKLFIKIDFTDLHLNNLAINEVGISDVVTVLKNKKLKAPIILTPGNIPSIKNIIDLYKFQENIFIELNLRVLGGQSPTRFFKNIFELPGFVQNWWNRVVLGSGSPTLEISQLVRGWYEATGELSMKFRDILRMWGFRNICRIMNIKIPVKEQIPLITYVQQSESNNQNIVHLGYDLSIQSFAITQFISIQDVFMKIFSEVLKKYPKVDSGVLTLKSYHTTTSLFINEHETGNYLDLHYHFVEECKKDTSNFMHTVAAKENRADFNFPDHLVSSTDENAHRSLTYHIRNGKVARGSRENVYALVTFGPRKVTIGADIILFKPV